MYLKSIEIQGFKSFANKTVFQFHNGITGIVGPNGSGKSNVADAVRWVLGEQRVRQLRGGNMQDVIFAGTQSRKPLGYAHVSITLSNEDHVLAVPYEEVTVSRRLYRSGESEYLLNGTQCRLRDVYELFYDTGIGKEGYSIIGQGQIDKILSGKPEDRRELFDEAAGIVKFKHRKNESQKKLDSERAALVRVGDILSELERQIGPLGRQAEKAKEYLSCREELKAVDVNLFLNEYQENRVQLEKLARKHDDASLELEEARKEAETVREAYDSAQQEMEALENQDRETSSKKAGLDLSIEQMNGQIEVLKEQIRAGAETRAEFGERLNILKEEISAQQEQEKNTLQEIRTAKQELEESETEGKKAQEAYSQAVEESARIREAADLIQQRVMQLLEDRTKLKTEQQRIETLSEQVKIRKSTLSSEILKLQSEMTGQDRQIHAIGIQLDTVQQKIDALGEESSRADEELSRCQDALSWDNQKLENDQAEYHRNASRLETLRGLAERYDGYGNSIRRVMEQRKKEKGILGVVADLIRTEERYEIAIETALGGSIQNIVTEDEAVARRMIAFLKQNRYGRATFLPLTAMKHSASFSRDEVLKEEGVIGLASSLVKADAKYRDLVKNLLGRTVVVDQIEHASAIAGKYHYTLRMVTLEGELLSPGGSMTGGAFANSTNLLGRRREIDDLTETLASRKKELEELKERIETTRTRRNGLRDDIREISEKLQEQYLKQNTLKMQLKEIENRQESAAHEEDRHQTESVRIRKQIMELSRDSVALNTKLEESEKQEEALGRELSSEQKKLEEAVASEAELLERVQSHQLTFVSLTRKIEYLGSQSEQTRQHLLTLQGEQERILQNIQQGENDGKIREERIARLQEEIARAGEQEAELEKQLTALHAGREEKNRQQKGFFEKREELSEHISLLDRECFRLNAQMEKLEEQGEARISYMWEEYGLTYSSALPLKRDDLGSKTAWKKTMAECRRRIRELGSVNVNAIEEYKEVSERYKMLTGQREDILKAEAALQKIIADLDLGMRRQFREQFARIAAEFDKTFSQMFGGGTGTLELMEDEDILECGIRIIAQPPGKKLQNMMQLSGGEKALTAIALLFAIQNLKPSPFCLLDEIEAALDENNVERYALYLRRLAKHTQFIIITHRRGTMTAADRLYGITMQEKGVSALVSVNLVENELDA